MENNEELWAEMAGHNNYEISTWGRVRNKHTKRVLKVYTNKPKNPNNKGVIKGKFGKYGYYEFHYHTSQAKVKHVYIHREVAKAFIPNPENKKYVDHIDGDSRNNRVENLRWVTASENMEYRYQRMKNE